MDIKETTRMLTIASKKKGFQYLVAVTSDESEVVSINGNSNDQFIYDSACGLFKSVFDRHCDTEEMWEGLFSLFSYDELYSAIRILLDTMDEMK